MISLRDRFWAKVRRDSHCWIWTGATRPTGHGPYGIMRVDGRNVQATHVSVFLTTGNWPPDQVCHHCDNTICVRFRHLFQGDQSDNVRDMLEKRRNPQQTDPSIVLRGERHGGSKLRDDDVRMIRRALASGLVQAEVARQFGVSQGTVAHIATGRKWSHVS